MGRVIIGESFDLVSW